MKVISFSAHTDDSELGCGGLLNRYAMGKGYDVTIVALSNCGNKQLNNEFKKASEILGCNSVLEDFEVRQFHRDRQKVLDYLFYIKNKLNPDLVLCPCSEDTHQDHSVLRNECFRAFKDKKVLGYELVWNESKGNMFADLHQVNLDFKIEALKQYESQKNRSYFGNKFITSLARVRGVQCGFEYAERLEVIRWKY